MTEKRVICPVCERGTLTQHTYSEDFKHNEGTVHVEGLEYCECDSCGADPVLKDQLRRNHKRVVDAKRAADGLLTGAEIRKLRERLGLTQKAASELFGGGANAFSKYERGDVVQSVPMDRLLRIVGHHPDLLAELGGKGLHTDPPLLSGTVR